MAGNTGVGCGRLRCPARARSSAGHSGVARRSGRRDAQALGARPCGPASGRIAVRASSPGRPPDVPEAGFLFEFHRGTSAGQRVVTSDLNTSGMEFRRRPHHSMTEEALSRFQSNGGFEVEDHLGSGSGRGLYGVKGLSPVGERKPVGDEEAEVQLVAIEQSDNVAPGVAGVGKACH